MSGEIDVLYVSHNRRDFTIETFTALLENTNWGLVRRVHVYDDASEDGTWEVLVGMAEVVPVAVELIHEPFGGPVAAMNQVLGQSGLAELLAKVDNDFVVCPDWLDILDTVLRMNPELDIIGTEPGILSDVPAEGQPAFHPLIDRTVEYRYRPCEHIGGKGLMRTRAFDGRPMKPSGDHGYFGFTGWQTKNPEVLKGWIDPDLNTFGLDQLPFEPWISLTQEYVDRGWMREWGKYSPQATDIWRWWSDGHPARHRG